MKKTVCLLLLLMLLPLTSCHSEKTDAREQLLDAPAARMEYANESNGGYKMITSEIFSLSSLASMRLVPTSAAFSGDWIYKIVFNPKEIVIDGEEMVVLFGESSVSIGGVNYIPEEGVSYSDILDWAAAKYKYFDYELRYDG